MDFHVMTSTSAPQPMAGQRQRVVLRQQILAHFNEEDLRTLCLDLGVEYDDLGGRGRAANVRELIRHVIYQRRLVEFIQLCQAERPSTAWDDLLQAAQINPDLFAVTPFDEEQTLSLGQGMLALAQLATHEVVRFAMRDFRQDFEAARIKVRLITHYKLLHDWLQEVETTFALLAGDRARLPAESDAWTSLMINQLVLEDPLAALLQTARESADSAQHGSWLKLFERGQVALTTAVTAQDLAQLDDGMENIYRALDRGMPRVNGRLVDAASDLPLNELVTAMTAVYDKLTALTAVNSSALDQFKHGVDALADLDEALNTLVAHHNEWQGIDDELRRVNTFLGRDADELAGSWPDIERMGLSLYGQSAERWAVSLQRIGDMLETALTTRPLAVTVGVFHQYRSQVSRRFRQVDDELLRLCQELQKIGEPLDVLLGTIQ